MWGYTINDAESLSDMLTSDEFNTMTANKYAGDVRIQKMIQAACMGIRDYCGWHIYPAQSCSFSERILNGNGRIKRVCADLMIQLPAAVVTSVESVTIDNTPWTDFSVSHSGLLRLFDVYFLPLTRKSTVSIEYTAGLPEGLMNAIKEIIAHRVTHALAVPAGIISEAAGGVSVTYNSNWSNNIRATALPDDNKEVLGPYRVQGVF